MCESFDDYNEFGASIIGLYSQLIWNVWAKWQGEEREKEEEYIK